ncbi:hypothetical protein H0G86_009131 [Trichoderma simmonsii]|uniref:NACHT domain-containing protein n=1 Tax=Trichoderma simmonsii TaxID=1491479 RepID=A0A8G0PMN4_9HYPO|nr:hypothetical protein H0G86_009131 [Trichoderma simmonsii]
MDVLGLLANISQVVDLLVKIGVMCSIYCVDVKKAPGDVRRLLKEVDRLTAVIKELESLLQSPKGSSKLESPSLRQAVFDLRRLLAELVAKLDLGVKHARAVWPFKKREVHEIFAAIERQKANILLNVNIEQTSVLLDVHQEIVLSKLRIADAAPFDSSIDGEVSYCLEGTRNHIIQQIEDWSSRPDSQSIFWLNGTAGTGKSTISRTVAQSFSNKSILGASFFFKRGEGDRGRASFLFTTIAAQLVRRIPSIAPGVREVLNLEPQIHEKPLREQFQKLILDPLKSKPGCWSSNLLIVIDALDECGLDDNMRTLINIFSDAQQIDKPRLKFFLTSRPELPIRLGFEDISGKYDNMLLAAVSTPTIEHDIGLFMRHQLNSIKMDYNKSVTGHRKISSDWPGDDTVRKLVASAIPLFIVAATICRFLSDRRLGGPHNQLSKLLEYQKIQTSGLDMTYLPVLDSLIVNLPLSAKQEVLTRFRYLVGSIITLAHPLSIRSLARLLDVSTDAVEDQLDLLHSVLGVPNDLDTPVRLLHLSFRDFLVDPAKKLDPIKYPFWVDEQLAHSELFLQCIKLLSRDGALKDDICSLQLPGTLLSDISQTLIGQLLPGEVQYACMYWTYHLNLSNRSICDGDMVDQFLRRYLLNWLEALTLMGRSAESVRMIDELLDKIGVSNTQAIEHLLQDTRRFVLANLGTFNKAPLQIYSSALVFAPKYSIVRRLFENNIPTWLCTLPTVQSHWDPCLATLEEDGPLLDKIMVFPEGGKFLSISLSGGIFKIWDLNALTCLETHRAASFKSSRPVIFSTDGRDLMYLSGHDVLQIMDYNTKSCLSEYIGHTGRITSALFSPASHRIASVSEDGTLRIWDRVTRKCLTVYDYDAERNKIVDFSPDGSRIIMISNPSLIHLLDTDKLGEKSIHYPYTNSLTSVCFSPNGQNLVSIDTSGIMKIWDNRFEKATIASGLSSWERPVVFFSDSNQLITPMKGPELRICLGIWDVSLVKCKLLDGHQAPITDIKLSRNESRIVSASRDKTIRIWDVSSGACIMTYSGHDQPVAFVSYLSDEKYILSTEFNGISKIWDTSLEALTTPYESHDGAILEVIYSPNKRNIITTSGDRTLRLWDASTEQCVAIGEHHQSFGWIPLVIPQDIASGPFDHTRQKRAGGLCPWPRSIRFSSDGSAFASATEGETAIKLWDATTGSFRILIQDAVSFESQIRSIVFSPDDSTVVSITRGGLARYCETATKTKDDSSVYTCDDAWGVLSLAFSEDGAWLITTYSNGIIKLINLLTREEEKISINPGKEVWRAAMSADGTKVASVSHGKLTVFDRNTQTFNFDYPKPWGSIIEHIAFSPNSQYLAAIYLDADVQLRAWDVATGTCVYEANICGLANNMAFDSMGSNLITNVGTVAFDPLPVEKYPPAGIEHQLPREHQQIGIGLSNDGEWITWNSQNMLWLPPSYRVSASDIAESTIALGSRLGRLLLIGIDPSIIAAGPWLMAKQAHLAGATQRVKPS